MHLGFWTLGASATLVELKPGISWLVQENYKTIDTTSPPSTFHATLKNLVV